MLERDRGVDGITRPRLGTKPRVAKYIWILPTRSGDSSLDRIVTIERDSENTDNAQGAATSDGSEINIDNVAAGETMELGFTRHAERRMRLYRISREDVAALIAQPDVTRPDPTA